MDNDTVTLTRAEYQHLLDARDHAVAMRDVATGATQTLSDNDLAAYLAAPSPLAFWREHRGIDRAVLADRAELPSAAPAAMEAGAIDGDVQRYARLARALGVSTEDLLPPA